MNTDNDGNPISVENAVGPLRDKLATAGKQGVWNAEMDQLCKKFVTACRDAGTSDCQIAGELLSLGLRSDAAWELLGHDTPPDGFEPATPVQKIVGGTGLVVLAALLAVCLTINLQLLPCVVFPSWAYIVSDVALGFTGLLLVSSWLRRKR